ncbi:MAG: hypothetical protein H7256_06640 [Bdellovibrio sp.]|nr:hypothetical protein [Bdellovibrio sp.]
MMTPQKKIFAVAIVFCITTFLALNYLTNKKSNLGSYSAASVATEPGYCLAIRGNGELEPAHWGGIAKTIEQFGLPTAMAGGSSASISMFWLNSVAQHPLIQTSNIDTLERNSRAALLVKSFLGFFQELKDTKFSQDFFNLYGQYRKSQAQDLTTEMQADLVKKNYPAVIRTLEQGMQLGLFSNDSLKPLILSLSNKSDKRSQFYLDELAESVRQFGKFDASTDANLFFRPPLVNFENASVSFGRFAAFYSARSSKSEIINNWANFFTKCTSDSEGASWAGLIKKNPNCGQIFHNIFQSYFQDEPKLSLENDMIGSPISVYPSTSVLIGDAALEAEKAFVDYDKQLDRQFGKTFKPTNPEEVLFGYWGSAAYLKKIELALDKSDEKSRRFFALGPATWKQVLSLSPAEPGLSPMKMFKANNQNIYSAGGWSDLHPAAILKAAGCQKIIYLTRRGGESLFAQGVANRLMSLNRDVVNLSSKIDSEKKALTKLNDDGDAGADPNSVWSKLFNLANPNSSVNFSLRKADAILCTNWNVFDVKTDLIGLIEDSYNSQYWLSQSATSDTSFKLIVPLTEKVSGCQPL